MNQRDILIVDSQSAWRELLCDHLTRAADLTVLDAVGSKKEAYVLIGRYMPKLMVLEVELADGCGLELCEDLQKRLISLRSLFVTTKEEDCYIARALDSEACGYLTKAQSLTEITYSILRALRGEVVWTYTQLFRASKWHREVGSRWNNLSHREREVLFALIQFKTDREIAAELIISIRTVNHHIGNTLVKLGVNNRREAARWALEHMLVANRSDR